MTHRNKTRKLQRTHQYDSGYKLQTSLLVNAASGLPIGHLRELSSHDFQWLIRAKEGNRIEYQGEISKVGEVAEQVETQQVKPVSYKGKQYMLHVGETHIRLTRAAKPKRKDHTGKKGCFSAR